MVLGSKNKVKKHLKMNRFSLKFGVNFLHNFCRSAEKLFKNEDIPLWLLILGSVAQVIFTLRFIYQWIYSERKKKSSLPLGFWLLSLIGGLLILTYAILRKDPVLFVGHLMGVFIYFRNMRLSIGIDKE